MVTMTLVLKVGSGFTILIWLVVSTPLKNISQLGLLFPMYGKKNVPNHQAVYIHIIILPYTYHPILSALLERNPAGTSHQQDLTAPPNPWTPLLKNSSFACPGCVMQRGITGAHGGHNRPPNTGATSQSMDSDNPKISWEFQTQPLLNWTSTQYPVQINS